MMMPKKTLSATDIEKGIELNTLKHFQFKPRNYDFTPKQKDLIGKILDPRIKIIFVEGPAGTSKTIVSMYGALKLVQDNPSINKILYLRSAIESASRNLGYMPGNYEDKKNHYMLPLLDKLDELLYEHDVHDLINNHLVESGMINFIRGADWKNQIIILDEAQNCTVKELQTVMTRISENSKLIIAGDCMQSDIVKSGLKEVKAIFGDQESVDHGITSVKFTGLDIVRSKIVQFVVEKFHQLF